MIYAGHSITSAKDPLKKIDLAYLYNSLKTPKIHIRDLIKRLQISQQLDVKQYQQNKRLLPYVVCANFSPPYRKKENFVFTEYFILDLDHFRDKGLELSDIRAKVQQDSQVCLAFISPSNDGLKLIFRLKEKCRDINLYSLFYKSFAKKFASRYNLNQVVDKATSDVTRACFISCDDEAYYNPNSEMIDIGAYLPLHNSDMLLGAFKAEVKAIEQEEKKTKEEAQSGVKKPIDPDDAVMQKIKQQLNPKLQNKVAKECYVPSELQSVVEGLKQFIEDNGLVIEDIASIQYGKKIKASLGLKKAEVNLFYGKRGFTVVISPRTGTDPSLNEVLALLVNSYID